MKTMSMSKWCEIDECCNAATTTNNGISVCERCRLGFVSVSTGAVFFSGRWHGVTGATYTDEACATFPGLVRQNVRGDLRGGPWARQSREGR